MKKKVLTILMISLLIPAIGFMRKNPKATEQNPIEKINSQTEEKNKNNNVDILNTKVKIETADSTVEDSLEEYLVGVAAAEISPNYENEAIKAQMVAAHTYAYNRFGENGPYPANPEVFQAYISKQKRQERYKENFDKYDNKLKENLKTVANKIITFDDKPIKATFYAMSSGKTQNCEDVWKNKVPYLVSVESPAEKNLKNFETKIIKSIKEVFEAVKTINPNAKIPKNKKDIIKILGRTDANYVKSVMIFDTEISGNQLRKILKLPSAAFCATVEGENLIFTCQGKGHGVGMSQAGANELAKQGKNYEDILKHYYPGTTIKTL